MAMSLKMPIGSDYFDRLRQDGCFYVDKTEMLYELFHEKGSTVTLFTRPRRFGKTLTMRMIESFFDINRDSGALFEGLDIMKHEAFCAEWRNKCPVLFITLKDAESLRFETAYAKLKAIIADVCKKHGYLLESERVDKDDREAYAKLKAQEGSDADVRNSLLILSRMMCAH